MKAIYKSENKRAFARRVLALLFIISIAQLKVYAQLNPLAAQYFINPYLANPAMAGIDKGLQINLHYSKQTGDVPGSPVNQSLTLAYGTEGKVGLGLNVTNDKAGLFNNTRIAGTYAYHLPIAENQQISFGLSLGVMTEKLNEGAIIGDIYDPAIRYFADRELTIDGDFGIAYLRDDLTLQAALPNLRGLLKNNQNFDDADRSRYFASAGYKLRFKDMPAIMFVEPKLAYRGIKGYDGIWDAGLNMALVNNWFNVMSLYHSTKSATFGFGLNYKSSATISFMYTTETSAQKAFGNNEFEMGLKLSL